MSDPIDLLKMKIERARELLPKETLEAIDAVPWREVIYNMRERKGYNLTQLEDLEIETELVLSGLVAPDNYLNELATRMKLSIPQAEILVEEINELIFKKIREELVKRIGADKILASNNSTPINNPIPLDIEGDKPNTFDIKVVKKAIAEKEEDKNNIIQSILGQKLSATHVSPQVKTEYSLGNISKAEEKPVIATQKEHLDPYRMNPGE